MDVNKLPEIFSRNVRVLMADVGHTTSSLAQASGIPQKTIWTMSRNKHTPTIVTATKLANALGVSLEALCTDEVSSQQLQRSCKASVLTRKLMGLSESSLDACETVIDGFLAKQS